MDLDAERALERSARERLRQLSRDPGLPRAPIDVLFGRAKIGIVDYACDHGVDLIIMGSHGHHGLARLLGSTTSAVNHAAPCDVLAVHLPENRPTAAE